MASDPYTLTLSSSELQRYRRMTADARSAEATLWAEAGIVPGAHVVDVGCGPGLLLVELAKMVQPAGTAVGVDRNQEALAVAPRTLADAGIDNATVRFGTAEATGLEQGRFSAVMMRHVLLHNPQPSHVPILRHLASLLVPGGSLVLAETDGNGVQWETPPHPVVLEMTARYNELLRRRGCEVTIGPRLGALVAEAGLDVVRRAARYDVIPPRHDGRRPFSWDSRDALLAAGLATPAEIDEWDRALTGLGLDTEPLSFLPVFVVVARAPGGKLPGRGSGHHDSEEGGDAHP